MEPTRLEPAPLLGSGAMCVLDSLDDVRWAVFETNGRISFILKSA